MKKLVLIALMLYSGLVVAHIRIKKKIDPKTGDTTLMTRETMLYNPVLKNLALNQRYQVAWSIEKLMAKGHRVDTLLFSLHFYGGAQISNTAHSPLLISFADGHTLTLLLRHAVNNQYGGASDRVGDSNDTYATYVLRPDDMHEMLNGQISSIKVTTVVGAIAYTVNAKSALKIPLYLSNVVKTK